MNAYAAHLLRAADDHARDGHADIAYSLRWFMWATRNRQTLERALRLCCDWDEDTLRRTLDAVDAEARGGRDHG